MRAERYMMVICASCRQATQSVVRRQPALVTPPGTHLNGDQVRNKEKRKNTVSSTMDKTKTTLLLVLVITLSESGRETNA